MLPAVPSTTVPPGLIRPTSTPSEPNSVSANARQSQHAAEEGTEWAQWPVEKLVASVHQLPEKLRAAVINQGGGHANHSLFWEVMSPKGGGKPEGALAKAIDEQLGGLEAFKENFTKAALPRFGSGWAGKV